MSTQGTHFKGPLTVKQAQSLTGPGVINTSDGRTLITTTGADAYTLADAPTEGQEKTIIMVGFVGIATITPANLLGFTTIALDAVGDSVQLIFTNGSWAVAGGNAATLA